MADKKETKKEAKKAVKVAPKAKGCECRTAEGFRKNPPCMPSMPGCLA